MTKPNVPQFFLAAAFVGITCFVATTSHAAYVFGDVNRDGEITIVDALIADYYYVGLEAPWFPTVRADVNCDSTVTEEDALLIAQYYVGLITEFPCSRTEQEELTLSADENADRFYDYLEERFGWAGLDGNGFEADIVFGNGAAVNNAAWKNNSLNIGEADGVGSLSWAYSEDGIAHELTHGVISYTSKLGDGLEAGAVNESMSDVMAIFASAQGDLVDWRFGENVFTPSISGDALRRLDNPHLGYHFETYAPCQFNPEVPFQCGRAQHMDEYVNTADQIHHKNNGILSYAAYLLVEGRCEAGICRDGIGVSKAEQIYFRTMTQYLSAYSTFFDVRHLLLTACNDLIGQFNITTSDCDTAADAFSSVGILPKPTDAPLGVSGYVTENGAPASASIILVVRGTVSMGQGGTGGEVELLSTTTDADGFYYFNEQDIAAALSSSLPWLTLSTIVYRVKYKNSNPSDFTRLSEWKTEVFAENTYLAGGTTAPTFDIAAPGPMTHNAQDPIAIPITFSWTPRTISETGDVWTEYYQWRGCTNEYACGYAEYDTSVHTMPTLTISSDNIDEINSNADKSLADMTAWEIHLFSYAGMGYTNLMPMFQ